MTKTVSRLILKRNYKGAKCRIEMLVHGDGIKGLSKTLQDFPRSLCVKLGVQNGLYLNFDCQGLPVSVTSKPVTINLE